MSNTVDDLVNQILKSKKLTKEELVEVLEKMHSKELVTLAGYLHSLLCTRNHIMECKFYDEVGLADSEEKPITEEWIRIARELCAELEMQPADVFMELSTFYTKQTLKLKTAVQFIMRNTEPTYRSALDGYVQKLNVGKLGSRKGGNA